MVLLKNVKKRIRKGYKPSVSLISLSFSPFVAHWFLLLCWCAISFYKDFEFCFLAANVYHPSIYISKYFISVAFSLFVNVALMPRIDIQISAFFLLRSCAVVSMLAP